MTTFRDSKISKGKSHIRTVRWGVPVKGDTCPEPSAL